MLSDRHTRQRLVYTRQIALDSENDDKELFAEYFLSDIRQRLRRVSNSTGQSSVNTETPITNTKKKKNYCGEASTDHPAHPISIIKTQIEVLFARHVVGGNRSRDLPLTSSSIYHNFSCVHTPFHSSHIILN